MTPSAPVRRGAGRPCLDFTGTLRHRGAARAVEELTDPAALDAWIHRCGPYDRAEDAGRADAADLLAARVLREAIHRLVTAARDGGGPAACDAASRDRVNSAAARPVPVPALDAAGRLRHHAAEPVAAALAVLARDALDLVASTALARVRACAGDGCGALFLDTSRPGTRRWCSMSACGNRAKKDAPHARH
ncbi:CGNR zinc finger domain-containing protein [Actinomadura violacea]|uniref:ABATE domain-containing protein n=1 Tax=Actinomadura violacea TaxID=2819934 RepID=A0ABS3RVU5_9ACTN|nr:ABATE domain-containing protein [Actinomadura violacea]MBO2460872.1 ABATE domain-containing protein [Actinomadura violacea]